MCDEKLGKVEPVTGPAGLAERQHRFLEAYSSDPIIAKAARLAGFTGRASTDGGTARPLSRRCGSRPMCSFDNTARKFWPRRLSGSVGDKSGSDSDDRCDFRTSPVHDR
jgi:hypothetical protein